MIGSNRFCHFGGWSDPEWISAAAVSRSAQPPGEGHSRWVVRPAQAEDFDAWEELFGGYCDFYARPSTPEHRRLVWSWIEAGTIHCLLAVPAAVTAEPEPETVARPEATAAAATDGDSAAAGHPVGLAHVRPVLSPLRGATVGFLDDLFVAPAARGTGAFECLMAAIRDLGAAEGWPQVRWITAADNSRAHSAYDRVATKTDWVTYQLDV
jgi:GNAT superfamily N-acetyltransferase